MNFKALFFVFAIALLLRAEPDGVRNKGAGSASEGECLLASIDFRAGRMEQSVAHFLNASAKAPLNEANTFTWAMAYVKLGDNGRAGALLSSLAVKYPERALYPYWLGRMDYNVRRYSEAEKKYRQAIALDPKFVRAWNALGLTYDMGGQVEQAREPLEKAAQLNRQLSKPSPWPPNDLGNWFLRANQWKEAEYAFSEALKYDSTMAQPHYRLARALEKQGQTTEAITEYKAAVEADKTSPDACYSLSLLYRKLSRLADAAAMLKEYQARKKASQ